MGKNKFALEHPSQVSRRKIKKRQMIKNSPAYQHYKGKVIVRNLSFQVPKEDLNKYFSKYGVIKEIIVPYGKNGQKRTFAFINFKDRGAALKAIKEQDKIRILGKKVTIDFALSQSDYTKLKAQKDPSYQDSKAGPISVSTEEVEPEDMSQDDLPESQDEEDQDLEDSDDDDDLTSSKNKKAEDSSMDSSSSQLYISNIPYDIKEKDLRKILSEYGLLRRCILCKYSDTGKSKGAAFVEYYSPQKAEQLLEAIAGELIMLKGRILKGRKVLPKEELPTYFQKLKESNKKRKNKDKNESDEE